MIEGTARHAFHIRPRAPHGLDVVREARGLPRPRARRGQVYIEDMAGYEPVETASAARGQVLLHGRRDEFRL